MNPEWEQKVKTYSESNYQRAGPGNPSWEHRHYIRKEKKKKKKIHSHHYTTLTTVSAFYRYILQRGSAPTTHILYFYYTFSHTARQMSLGMAGASNCCVILCLVIFLFSETALVSQVFVMVTNDVMNIFVHRGVLVQLCDPQWAFFFFLIFDVDHF